MMTARELAVGTGRPFGSRSIVGLRAERSAIAATCAVGSSAGNPVEVVGYPRASPSPCHHHSPEEFSVAARSRAPPAARDRRAAPRMKARRVESQSIGRLDCSAEIAPRSRPRPLACRVPPIYLYSECTAVVCCHCGRHGMGVSPGRSRAMSLESHRGEEAENRRGHLRLAASAAWATG